MRQVSWTVSVGQQPGVLIERVWKLWGLPCIIMVTLGYPNIRRISVICSPFLFPQVLLVPFLHFRNFSGTVIRTISHLHWYFYFCSPKISYLDQTFHQFLFSFLRASRWHCLFFVLYVLLGVYFVTNLILAVIYDSFKSQVWFFSYFSCSSKA